MLFTKNKHSNKDFIFIDNEQKFPVFFDYKLNEKYYKNKQTIKHITFENGVKLFYRFLKNKDSLMLYLNFFKERNILGHIDFKYRLYRDFHKPFDFLINRFFSFCDLNNKNETKELKQLVMLRREWDRLLRSVGLIN